MIEEKKRGLSFWLCTLMAGLIVTVLGPAWDQAAAAPRSEIGDLEVQVGQTVEIASSSDYNWFPTIHKFTTGEIMVTIRMGPDAEIPGREVSGYCISRDGGLTWGRRYSMGEDGDMDGAWSEAPQKDGRIWHLYTPLEPFPAGQSQVFHATLTKFSRGGTEVAIARDVVIRLSEPMHMVSLQSLDRGISDHQRMGEDISGFPWGPIFEGLNGDLMAPVYYNTERDPRYYRLGLLRSSNGGKTWSESATIAALRPGEKPWPWMGKEGPCETGIVRLADKRLYAIFRTGAFMGQAWSSNDGKTWTPPTSTPYKGVALRIRRLSDGVLACTYGRPGPVTIMFNLDGTAKKWSHITPIFSGMSTRYTDFIELGPGKLLVVYDSVPYSWDRIPEWDQTSKNVVYGTFIDVRKK